MPSILPSRAMTGWRSRRPRTAPTLVDRLRFPRSGGSGASRGGQVPDIGDQCVAFLWVRSSPFAVAFASDRRGEAA